MVTKESSCGRYHPTNVQKKELPKDMTNMSEEEKMGLGIELFDQGSYIEAIEVFSRIAGHENMFARQYLARSYYRLDLYESAFKHFSYLAEHAEGATRDYGASMVAAIEIMWGNYGKAIRGLKRLPENPTNLINLAIVYWNKYTVEKDEQSIWEAFRLLKKIYGNSVSTFNLHKAYRLQALLYQAQKEFRMAESYYQKALEISDSPIDSGALLNDYASLHIEEGDFDKAKRSLDQAYEMVKGVSELEEAFNNKWYGILAILQDEQQKAKEYLEKAVQVIRDKGLLQELAGIFYTLADLTKDENFFKAAEYFSNGLSFERLSEEVKERNEKIIQFYFDSFFNGDCNVTHSSWS